MPELLYRASWMNPTRGKNRVSCEITRLIQARRENGTCLVHYTDPSPWAVAARDFNLFSDFQHCSACVSTSLRPSSLSCSLQIAGLARIQCVCQSRRSRHVHWRHQWQQIALEGNLPGHSYCIQLNSRSPYVLTLLHRVACVAVLRVHHGNDPLGYSALQCNFRFCSVLCFGLILGFSF